MLSVRRTDTAAGRVERTQPVQECAYSDVREGDSVPRRLPDEQSRDQRDRGGPENQRTSVADILLLPAIRPNVFRALFWPRYSQLLRDRELFRTGTLARGTVVFVVRQQDSWWPGWPLPTRADVYVQTRLPIGQEREVRAVCTNDWLLAHLPPGAEVTVAYRPGKPSAVLLENYLR